MSTAYLLSILYAQNGENGKKKDIDIQQPDVNDEDAVIALVKALDPTEQAPFGPLVDVFRGAPPPTRPTPKEVLARYGITSMQYNVNSGPICNVGA